MPYKKGPNGTLRYYSSSTGRYCDDPSFLTMRQDGFPKMSNRKKRNSEEMC